MALMDLRMLARVNDHMAAGGSDAGSRAAGGIGGHATTIAVAVGFGTVDLARTGGDAGVSRLSFRLQAHG